MERNISVLQPQMELGSLALEVWILTTELPGKSQGWMEELCKFTRFSGLLVGVFPSPTARRSEPPLRARASKGGGGGEREAAPRGLDPGGKDPWTSVRSAPLGPAAPRSFPLDRRLPARVPEPEAWGSSRHRGAPGTTVSLGGGPRVEPLPAAPTPLPRPALRPRSPDPACPESGWSRAGWARWGGSAGGFLGTAALPLAPRRRPPVSRFGPCCRSLDTTLPQPAPPSLRGSQPLHPTPVLVISWS